MGFLSSLSAALSLFEPLRWLWEKMKGWRAGRKTQLRAGYCSEKDRFFAENIEDSAATDVELELLLSEQQNSPLLKDDKTEVGDNKTKTFLEEVYGWRGRIECFPSPASTDKDTRPPWKYVIRWENVDGTRSEHEGTIEKKR